MISLLSYYQLYWKDLLRIVKFEGRYGLSFEHRRWILAPILWFGPLEFRTRRYGRFCPPYCYHLNIGYKSSSCLGHEWRIHLQAFQILSYCCFPCITYSINYRESSLLRLSKEHYCTWNTWFRQRCIRILLLANVLRGNIYTPQKFDF